MTRTLEESRAFFAADRFAMEACGITIDEVKNREQGEAVRISDGTSRVNVLVIKTNEELEIAREAAELVRGLKKEE